MFDIIIAHNLNYGIGCDGKIPWHCPDDLKLFKKLTMNSVLVVGRKTVESLPILPGRIVFCISRSTTGPRIFRDLQSALDTAKNDYPEKKIFVAGGGEIYKLAFTTASKYIDNIHISVIQDNSRCDTFVSELSVWTNNRGFYITEIEYMTNASYYLLKRNKAEKQYLTLLSNILHTGDFRQGRNGETKSLFGEHMFFDLRDGFPLLTTKKMFFRGIVEELLFFIRGDTNSKLLEEKGVNIWKSNTSRAFLDKIGKPERSEGIMGPLYGFQWRHFNAKYDEKSGTCLEKGIDQLSNVVELIRKDPYSRRILMSDFNPCQVEDGVLYPCHSIIIQFYVSENYLDMFCYNRSQDVFLGTPFNIASSSLLLILIAAITNLTPRFLYMRLGDVHIYKQHYDNVQEQITRMPYKFPKLLLKKEVKEITDLEALTSSDIEIENYKSHPAIKAEMIA